MFTQFSANMNNFLSREEYRLTNFALEDVSSTSHWIMQKTEMATLINVHLIDFEKISWENLIAYEIANRNAAEMLLNRVSQVASIYVLVGGTTPNWQGAEDYFGQPIYSVFWHMDVLTGKISHTKGQPKNLFGLKPLVERAYKEISLDGPVDGLDFKKEATYIKPKHNQPVITYFIIAVNLIILLLMYLSGFQNDITVPLRFGAIHPHWVHEYGQWYRLFTAMFVHFGAMHFGANTFGLLVFGTRVERYFGRVTFCLIYILAGLLGSAFSLFISQAYAAGASGAIYGLVGALFAYTRVTKRSVDIMNWYIMFVYIGVGIAMGFVTPGIDNAAHIGGLIGGAVIGYLYALWFGKGKAS